jgi:hypothetical protein
MTQEQVHLHSWSMTTHQNIQAQKLPGKLPKLLIATGHLLGAKPRPDTGATWQGPVFPARIDLYFRQQRIWHPTEMGPAQVQDGITHFRRKHDQGSGDGPTYLGTTAAASLLLPSASPFAYRLD